MEENTTNNLTTIFSSDIPRSSYERNRGTFWAFAAIYLCIGLVAVIGNGLVLYASFCTRNLGRLRYFDTAIKSLALADMLFGLVGVPCRFIASYYIGILNYKILMLFQ